MNYRGIYIYCLFAHVVMISFGAWLIIQHASERASNAAIIGGLLHGVLAFYFWKKRSAAKA